METARRIAFWVLLSAVAPALLGAQGRTSEEANLAYSRAVGEHFRVPSQEVNVLSEWGLSLEEIPVVLYLARRGGVSADALAALRSNGRSWFQLARRSGLDAAAFLASLPESASAGPLASAYEKWRSSGGVAGNVELDDAEVVGLVNFRFLMDFTHSEPQRVLAAYQAERSWVAAYQALVAR